MSWRSVAFLCCSSKSYICVCVFRSMMSPGAHRCCCNRQCLSAQPGYHNVGFLHHMSNDFLEDEDGKAQRYHHLVWWQGFGPPPPSGAATAGCGCRCQRRTTGEEGRPAHACPRTAHPRPSMPPTKRSVMSPGSHHCCCHIKCLSA